MHWRQKLRHPFCFDRTTLKRFDAGALLRKLRLNVERNDQRCFICLNKCQRRTSCMIGRHKHKAFTKLNRSFPIFPLPPSHKKSYSIKKSNGRSWTFCVCSKEENYLDLGKARQKVKLFFFNRKILKKSCSVTFRDTRHILKNKRFLCITVFFPNLQGLTFPPIFFSAKCNNYTRERFSYK